MASNGIACLLHHGFKQLVEPVGSPLQIQPAEQGLQGGGGVVDAARFWLRQGFRPTQAMEGDDRYYLREL